MDYFAAVLIPSHRLSLEAFSALPDAPVVPYVEPLPRLHRTRSRTADLLHRLGDVIASPPPACGSQA